MAHLNLYRLLLLGTFFVSCLTACNLEEYKTKYPGAIFTLSTNDKAILDNLLDQFISARETKMKAAGGKEQSGIALRQFIRQVIPAYDSANNKIVWVNCRCNTEPFRWRESIIYAGDYDDCFISVYLNLTKGRISRQAVSPF
jgi:hypothetical protein